MHVTVLAGACKQVKLDETRQPLQAKQASNVTRPLHAIASRKAGN
jgi:hypothetical protein